ncbi:hypothetical protein TREES_T100005576 [Tupaia chinensis]|uniref:Major intrinsically disordered Notch2-binding receptor 1-like C-terminal domain-containing protein n=1 Tax=Tupaia chinensis TaxID=246437 RepID=L9JFT0_TUPCH|nr:hypothetical protein TREES_T100005576 [Tupaia chinensis]
MDLSVLPNNNHPDKFLQLDVKSLMSSALLPASLKEKKKLAIQPSKGSREKRAATVDSPPPSMSSVMKNNPLYGDMSMEEAMEERKKSPSWTIEEYDKHSLYTNLSECLKENPNDLRFWLGDMYTPGFDTLLKKEEKQQKQSQLCRLGLILLLVTSILVTIVMISTLLT